MSKDLPSTICPVPWLNLSLDVNGSVRPCCKFEQPERSTRNFGVLTNDNLAEIWNSEAMVQLRRDFRDGKKPSECSACWSEEAAGITSLRQEFVQHRVKNPDVDYSSDTPEAPKTLDLKLSNACNLKCRICGPVASSLHLKESLANGLDWNGELKKNQQPFLSNKITEHPKNRETFIGWLHGIEHVEMFGGEPLLIQENRDIEKLLVEHGRSDQVTLLYNTNTTIFNEAAVEKWKSFKRVQICLSVDDLGKRQEYQRFPSNWDTIQKNVKKYQAIHGGNIQVHLFCTVSTFNVWYIPEFVQWAIDEVPNLEIRFNFVHNPQEFCITNLPPEIKYEVQRKISQSLDEINTDGHCEADKILSYLDSVAAFMYSRSPEPPHWQMFLQRVSDVDRMRRHSFASVFPEYSSRLGLSAT